MTGLFWQSWLEYTFLSSSYLFFKNLLDGLCSSAVSPLFFPKFAQPFCWRKHFNTRLIHQCCIAYCFFTLDCFLMPISLCKKLQIPILISNQSFFLSQAKQFAGRREPFAAELPPRAHSLRKGGTVEHPSPAPSPECALKCRSSKSSEIKRVGVWRQFSNPSSRAKLI